MYKELDSARNAFAFVLKEYGIKRIHIPYYLCDVMRHMAFSLGCKVEFYHIDNEFMPINDFKKDSYILYPNYFGVCDNNVNILVSEYQNIIIDNAHSYYSSPNLCHGWHLPYRRCGFHIYQPEQLIFIL